MNKTQGIVIVLLVLAIIFSGVSIYIGFSALDKGPAENEVLRNVAGGGSGSVGFFVESTPEAGGEG